MDFPREELAGCLSREQQVGVRWLAALLVLTACTGAARAHAAGPIGPRLAARLATAAPDDSAIVWVYLRYRAGAGTALSPRALARRAQRAPLSLGDPVDARLDDADVRAVAAAGLRPRVTSRWLRAVSGCVRVRDLPRVAALPIVQRLDLVAAHRVAPAPPVPESAPPGTRAPSAPGEFTHTQLAQVGIDSLHALGYRGEGVMIGVLDTGFTRRHAAVVGATVAGTRDMIHGDAVVENETGQDVPQQDDHGTQTWGLIAGNVPGTYIGGAPHASFALAKTENILSETRIEEDFWVAGIEWADSLGVDVVSSSLGYNFVGTDSPYVYADMDGNTATTTIAADAAVARGIVVVNSAGNEGNNTWRHVLAPADGDSVLAVGAVDSLGMRVSFSSVGPTADGRIKPDLMAMGSRTAVINPNDSLAYGYGGGTSFAAPLVASLCALLLQAHPDWSPVDVGDALRATANRASAPDTLSGWGVPRGVAALAVTPTLVGGDPDDPMILALSGPQPARAAVSLAIRCTHGCAPIVRVFDAHGRRVTDVQASAVRSGGTRWEGRWDLRDHAGRVVPSGVYLLVASDGARRLTRRLVIAR